MNPKLAYFGDKDNPLRMSSLPMLLQCPLRSVLLFLREFEDDVGSAAHTGSAVHKAVEFWHDDMNYDRAMSFAQQSQKDYPKVDWKEVELYFRPYTQDPRNRPEFRKVITKEQKVEITLQAKTGPIKITGTLDQISLDTRNNRAILYDVKTGKTYGAAVTAAIYSVQLAAYWVAAVECGHRVDSIGVIHPYTYRARGANLPSPDGVFWPLDLTFDQAKFLLEGVIQTVNSIRMGEIPVVPGPHCNFCPAQSPTICVPLWSTLHGKS